MDKQHQFTGRNGGRFAKGHKLFVGEKHPQWKDVVDHSTLHHWLRRNYGRANKCENQSCPQISLMFDYALKRGCEYRKNIENFLQLCRSCHLKYDYTEERKRKIGKVHLGMKRTLETRAKMSLARKSYYALLNKKLLV